MLIKICVAWPQSSKLTPSSCPITSAIVCKFPEEKLEQMLPEENILWRISNQDGIIDHKKETRPSES